MRRDPGRSGRPLSAFVVAGALCLAAVPAGAQSLLNNGRPIPPPTTEPAKPRVERTALPRGTHFETGRPDALAAAIDSDRTVELWMHPTPRSIQMFFSPVGADGGSFGAPGAVSAAPAGEAAPGTVGATHRLTVSGLAPEGTFYLYRDDLQNAEVITADAEGRYAFDLELPRPRLVILQSNPSTFHLRADGSGCGLIGDFDLATLTCTLDRDVRQSIEIEDDGITLDGAGFMLDGTGPLFGAAGVFVRGRKNVTVRNLVIDRADTGVTLNGTSDSLFENITIRNGSGGFMELFDAAADSGHNIFRNNDVSVVCPPDIPCGFGVQTILSNESTITDNVFTGIKFGVQGILTLKIDVQGNAITDCPTGVGIASSLSPATVADNDITGASVGITLGTAINCAVTGNVVDGSTEVGLRLTSLGCTVSDNTFSNGTLGMDLSGLQNTLFHNRFVANTTQVWLGPNATGNVFNGPLGGNFWSDFDESTEGCDDTDADGFCDAPYVLSLGSDLQPWAADSGWLDDVPPTTSALISGVPGENDWYTSAVDISLTAEDNPGGTGVLLTEFAVDGGPFSPGSATQFSSEGSQSLSFRSIDRAGNAETAQSATIRIDTVAPSITATRTPPPNAAGWNNEPVDVSFECTDATSGIVTCSPGTGVVSETAGTSIQGIATDDAGHQGETSVLVKIDMTDPAISGFATTAANGHGWHDSPVTVHFDCTDALSGIASCTPDANLGEGLNQSADGTAVDNADNTASTTVSGINIDLTAPTISAIVAPPPNAAGWHNADATVSFTCSDALSGLDTCPGPRLVETEGESQTISGKATDIAGNVGSAEAIVSLDKTAPAITAEVSPTPNAAGWNHEPVTVHFACSDALSGVASCPGDAGIANEGANQQLVGTGFDVAGNAGSAPVSVSIDMTAPSVGFAGTCGGIVNLNQPASTTVAAADALSGIAAQSLPNGPNALPTDTVGPKSATLIATDVADNQASTTCDYTVVYDFLGAGGFNAPVDMPPILNIAKAGSTIPVKWRVPDGLGGWLSSLEIVSSIQAQEVACSDLDDGLSDPIDTTYAGASGLHFDPEENQFIYNWKSTAGMAGKCFLLQLNLNDGQTHEAHIKFRS